MPVDATPNLAAFAAGDVPTATQLDTWRAALDALSNTWTSYTPVWSGTGGNPTIGNGTIVGSYMQVGKLVHFKITITVGSTTTTGSGTYALSLPVTAVDTNWSCPVFFFDSSLAVNRIPGVASPTTTTSLWAYSTGGATANGQWTATCPSAPATGDKFVFAGTYEAA